MNRKPLLHVAMEDNDRGQVRVYSEAGKLLMGTTCRGYLSEFNYVLNANEQQVTTLGELEALPVGSVILDRSGMALQKTQWAFDGTGWNAVNGTRDIEREELELDCFPAAVLHVGATS